MNDHDYKQTALYLIYLIRCVLNNKVPAKEKLDKMDLSQLYEVAKAHSLTAMAAFALESAGVYDERFIQEQAKVIRKNALFDIEREHIFAEFEKAGIWYLPMKGIILNDYFPKYGMRQMCDNDILFDKTRISDVERIMKYLDYEVQPSNSSHDITFYKRPVLNFEMHYALFDDYKKNAVIKYFADFSNGIVANDSFRKSFSDDYFYLYLTAHEYNHFKSGGTGLRFLVDVYVFLKNRNNSLDWDHLNIELDKIGLMDFEKKRRVLALDLFNSKKLTDPEKELLDYYIFSTTYGTIENRVKNGVHNQSKLKYLVNRLFPPLEVVKNEHPFFAEHKCFLPLLFLYRIGLMLSKSRKKVMAEIKTLIKL